jgi:hypothetical protein
MKDKTLEEEFNIFIHEWCINYSHLIDDDDNDGERFRKLIREHISKQKVKEAIDRHFRKIENGELYIQSIKHDKECILKELGLE